MAAPSMGYAAQLGMDASSATVTEAYEFTSETITMDQALAIQDGIRGSRARTIERVKAGIQTIGGSLTMNPSPAELRKLLPRILGGAETADTGFATYALAETLPSFYLVVDRVAKVYTYTGCYVDSAVFKSGQGQLLDLTMMIEALSESVGAAGTFPSLTIDTTTPFIFHEVVLTLGGTSIPCMELEITIDNMLKKDRFTNSQTRTHLPPMDRRVSIKATAEYTSTTTALYNTGVAGVTATAKFNYGGAGAGAAGKSLLFTFGNVIFPAKKSPAVGSKDEITLVLEGDARKTSTTPEVAVALDYTA